MKKIWVFAIVILLFFILVYSYKTYIIYNNKQKNNIVITVYSICNIINFYNSKEKIEELDRCSESSRILECNNKIYLIAYDKNNDTENIYVINENNYNESEILYQFCDKIVCEGIFLIDDNLYFCEYDDNYSIKTIDLNNGSTGKAESGSGESRSLFQSKADRKRQRPHSVVLCGRMK